jgi:hypothetical protein
VLPKGTYVPHYDRLAHTEYPAPAAHPEPPAFAPPVPVPPRAPKRKWWLIALLSIIGLVGAAALVETRMAKRPTVDPILREAWGPLAAPDANVLISVATPLHLTVVPESHKAAGSPSYPAPEEGYPIWRRHRPLAPGAKLELVFTDNVIGFGTMNSVLAAVNTLRQLGTSYQIFPERVAPISTFRNRNVMLFGAPVDSEAVSRSHESTPLLVDFEPSISDFVIRDKQTGKMLKPVHDEQGEYREVYGLVTVLNNRDTETGRLGLAMFSGITSAGTHGAMEYFASPRSLHALRARFAKEGIEGFRAAYQVVVKCTFSNMLLLSYEWVEHRVLQR